VGYNIIKGIYYYNFLSKVFDVYVIR